MFEDPHFIERGLFEQVSINGEPLKIPAIMPRLTATPGGTKWPGPELGSHNQAVFGEILGLSAAELAEMKELGII